MKTEYLMPSALAKTTYCTDILTRKFYFLSFSQVKKYLPSLSFSLFARNRIFSTSYRIRCVSDILKVETSKSDYKIKGFIGHSCKRHQKKFK